MIRSHAVRLLVGAAAHTFAHPVTASFVAYRRSQPPGRGGGATRSRRFGMRYAAGRAMRPPAASVGRRRRRASFGSAWISAVARHSRTSWLIGPYVSSPAAAAATRENSSTNARRSATGRNSSHGNASPSASPSAPGLWTARLRNVRPNAANASARSVSRSARVSRRSGWSRRIRTTSPSSTSTATSLGCLSRSEKGRSVTLMEKTISEVLPKYHTIVVGDVRTRTRTRWPARARGSQRSRGACY